MGRARGSLLQAVFWRMGLTMLLAIAAVSILSIYEFRQHVDGMRDRSLTGQATDILRHIKDEGGALRLHLPSSLSHAYSAEIDPPRFVVLGPDNAVIAASPQIRGALSHEAPPPMGQWQFFQSLDPISGTPQYGVAFRPHEWDGQIVIQATQNGDHYDVLADTLLDEVVDEYLWVLFVVFGVILVVTFITLRRALSPLRQVSQDASAIGPGSIDRRLSVDALPSEIRPLVIAVNSALDRVEEGFRVQQRFTADAAHEMRTPIALLHGHIDRLGLEESHSVRRDLINLERVVGQLLKLAQVDAMVVPEGSIADLREVAMNVIAYLAPKAIAQNQTLALEGDERVSVPGDPDALEVALRNLVENALAHTPDGEEVVIQLTQNPATLSVLDRGPGIAREDRAHLFERFWRKDRRKGNGAGLGLSIVSRIAESHGADLRIRDRDGGGSAFEIQF